MRPTPPSTHFQPQHSGPGQSGLPLPWLCLPCRGCGGISGCPDLGPDPGCHLPPARVTQLVRGFASTWKTSVESLSQDVMRSFSNFKNGTSIIQVGHEAACLP